MDVSRYNKVIAAVAGALVSFALVWLSMKTSLAQCIVVDSRKVCTLLGMSEGELTGLVVAIITSFAVLIGPKNTVTNQELIKEVASKKDLVKNVELKNTAEGHEINAQTPGNVTVSSGK